VNALTARGVVAPVPAAELRPFEEAWSA
jgi:hypothetical protein